MHGTLSESTAGAHRVMRLMLIQRLEKKYCVRVKKGQKEREVRKGQCETQDHAKLMHSRDVEAQGNTVVL